VALLFGGSQALMPMIGWAVGARFGSLVQAWDHWIAFVLLGGLGAKMLWEARKAAAGEDDDETPDGGDPFALGAMIVLAVATSIDALAVGVTLPMLGAPFARTLLTIGLVTAGLSTAGLFAGRRLGAALGARLDVLGGLALIGLGAKILVEHLNAA
jgi:putative Mn2+ efflux pump MntP